MPEQAVEAQIAERLGDLMSHYYGHGPTRTRGIIADDVVVVLMDETFSKAELKLIEIGQVADIKHVRRSFQEHMEQDFRSVVEEATGRKVTAFISDTDIDQALAVEVFVLGEAKTDMGAFEREPTQVEDDRSNEPG